MAISVAVAVGDIADRLVARLAERVPAIHMADGMDPKAEMGPLVTAEHLAKVRGYVDQGVKEGANLVVDGRGLALQGYEKGFFLGGCLFDNVTTDMRIYKEEIFGPVLAVMKAATVTDALEMANSTNYALTGGIYSRSPANLALVRERFDVGNLYVNRPIKIGRAHV